MKSNRFCMKVALFLVCNSTHVDHFIYSWLFIPAVTLWEFVCRLFHICALEL